MRLNKFAFLKQEWDTIYEIIVEIENNLYINPNISLIKLRQLEEVVIKAISEYEDKYISIVGENLKTSVESLINGGIIPKKFLVLLNEVRRFGNKAAHENYSDLSKAQSLFELSYEFLVWFACNYSNNDYSDFIRLLDIQDKVIFQEYLLEKRYIISKGTSLNTKASLDVDYDPLSISMPPITKELITGDSNYFTKDVFETDGEFKLRIESSAFHTLGIAKIEINEYNYYNDTLLFHGLINKGLPFRAINFNIFYVETQQLREYIKIGEIIKCNLLGKLIVKEGVVQVDKEELYIKIKDNIIHISPLYLKKYNDETLDGFNQRISKLPSIVIGISKFKKQEYNIELEIFPIDISYFKFAEEFNKFKDAFVFLNKEYAKKLYETSIIWSIQAKFKVIGSTAVIQKLFISVNNSIEELSLIPIQSFDDDFEMIKFASKCYSENKSKMYKLLNMYAEHGNYIAIHLLSEISENNIKLKSKDLKNIKYNEDIINFLKESETKEDPQFQYILGEIYSEGLGVEEDNNEAIRWYEKSANHGNSNGEYGLGILYYLGEGIEQDYKKAMEWLRKSAEQGNDNAEWFIGQMYYSGEGVEQDYKKAMEWLRKSAEKGNDNADWIIGLMYYSGEGVEQDYKKAMEWLRKSAEQENNNSEYLIGQMHYLGEGVRQDYKKAMEWLRKSAEQENEYAEYMIGKMYYLGQGIEQDYKKAMEWLEKSAEQKNDNAEYLIGKMYYLGEGVEQDYRTAMKWLRKSANQGNDIAEYLTGQMYYLGEGVEQDYKKAMEWLRKSAEQGNNNAEYLIGEMYYLGEGININYRQASVWLEKSEAHGNDDAKQLLDKIRNRHSNVR